VTPAPSAAPPVETSVQLFERFVASVNRGDLEGALAVFADDVTWERGGQCPPGACVGKPAVQGELTRDIANHHALAIVGSEPLGELTNVRVELQTDMTRRAGIRRVIQIFTLGTRDGRIVSVRTVNDVTDADTAAFTGGSGKAK
jgi:ketosteroid isomerase-like protein